jgi:hypothetical protein
LSSVKKRLLFWALTYFSLIIKIFSVVATNTDSVLLIPMIGITSYARRKFIIVRLLRRTLASHMNFIVNLPKIADNTNFQLHAPILRIANDACRISIQIR